MKVSKICFKLIFVVYDIQIGYLDGTLCCLLNYKVFSHKLVLINGFSILNATQILPL